MTAVGRKIAISAHIEIEWLDGPVAQALCPNCGVQAEVRQILDIDYRPPVEHDDEHRFVLQICPACSVRFVDNMKMMEYNTERLVERGEDAFHVQLGAGIWPITGQLARLDQPRGAKVLEIGGGFGFGLDFALRARGWDGVGYDPSPFAAEGMRELDLPLHQEYFTVRHLALGPWDVAIATELLEHVSYPAAFLLLMRKALGETGVLMLSTPNAECVTPDQPVSNLLPLLSPGSHTVLQTRRSLELALRAAGFAYTHIIEDGLSLIAYGSAAPIRLIEDDAARRAMYRNYLVERAGLAAETSDLRFGFAGRGIFEAVNDGDWAAADAAWAALLPAAQARFGLNLQGMTALPPGAAEASLAELARKMPLGLGMILFGRAMRLLEAGHGRVALEPMLRLALEAIDVLLGALAKHSLQDALSASLAGLLRTELLICAAAAGRDEAVAGLLALGDEETAWRGFMEMVNAGAMAPAAALRVALPEMPGPALPAPVRRNILLMLVNFHFAPGGDPRAPLVYAPALAELGENTAWLVLGSFVRLVSAGAHEAAQEMEQTHGIAALASRHAGETMGSEALTALVHLDVQPVHGNPMRISRWLDLADKSALSAEQVVILAFSAFSMLVNQGNFEAGRRLLSRVDPLLLKLRPPFTPAACDALFAAGILFMQERGELRRSAASFARLHDGLIKMAPPGEAPGPLFWPALRGEVVALNQLSRGDEAMSLLRSFLDAYPGAPDDLREQLKTVKKGVRR